MAETPTQRPSQSMPDGIRAAAKYNPHLWNAEELRAIFVARRRELEDILQALKRSPANQVPQHRLLIGPRGMARPPCCSGWL